MSTRSRWLDWEPGTPAPSDLAETPAQKFFKNAKGEPTKTTKTISVVFVGSTPGGFQNFLAEAKPDGQEGKSNTFGGCNPAEATPPADFPELPAPAEEKLVWMDWYEWKAAALNRLFQELGVTGEPGRITAATVRHGERTWRGR